MNAFAVVADSLTPTTQLTVPDNVPSFTAAPDTHRPQHMLLGLVDVVLFACTVVAAPAGSALSAFVTAEPVRVHEPWNPLGVNPGVELVKYAMLATYLAPTPAEDNNITG